MLRSRRWVAFATILYGAIVAATHYTYFADPNAYIANILAFDHDAVAGRPIAAAATKGARRTRMDPATGF